MTRPAPIVAIVAANLRRQTRDKVGMLFLVIMPFVAIVFVGFALGGSSTSATPIGVVASGTDPIAGRVLDKLAGSANIEVTRFDDEASLADAIRYGTIAAGISMPEGQSKYPVSFSATSGVGVAARAAISTAVDQVAAEMEAVRAAESAGASVADATRFVAGEQVASVQIAGSGRTTEPRGFAYAAPANLVLFTFINSLAVAAALVESRKLGMVRRALAGPVSKGAVLCGEALSRLIVAIAQAVLIVTVSAVLFGVSWGDPLAVVVIIGLFCLVATGAAMLLGSLAKSASQPAILGPTVGIVLGMLGGCLWPKEIAPALLNTIGYAFPHSWAMDALIKLSEGRTGLGSVLTEIVVLAAMATALLATALVVFDRRVLTGR